MKIGFYSPYLDSFGGGERYLLTLVSHWSRRHEVHIFWNDPNILAQSEKRFHISLGDVKREPNIFSYPLHRKLWLTVSYDLLFVLSDGSIPIHAAKKGILHFQVPFRRVNFPSWKRRNYQRIVCNSEFTETYLDKSIPVKRSVIYPPVETKEFHAGKKENTIVSVGRFNGHRDVKKQRVLIQAFREGMKRNILTGWNLILAGSMLPSDEPYLAELKRDAKGLPVSFFPNCSFTTLVDVYSHARIYWHAAGYEETNPEHMEHFGISTVEAMASGCIPVVFSGGGQPEIVSDGKNGYLWKTTGELLTKTMEALKKNSKFVGIVQKRSMDFSEKRFTEAFDTLLTTL